MVGLIVFFGPFWAGSALFAYFLVALLKSIWGYVPREDEYEDVFILAPLYAVYYLTLHVFYLGYLCLNGRPYHD